MERRLFLIGILSMLILMGGCIDSEEKTKNRIRNELMGYELNYTGITGDTLKYTITAEVIKEIEKTEVKDKTVWKVRVEDGLRWDIYFEESGNEIVSIEQLFRT